MTNAEAIETLRANYPDACYEQLREAVDVAIEALNAQGAAGDTISRQAVEHLDWFAKLYCMDKSITDDLVFRCKQCEFKMPDKTCLVKVMARKLCPDYKDFGAMGDL